MLISFNMYINLSSDVLNQVLEMDVTEAVVGVARIDTTLVGVPRVGQLTNWNLSYDWKDFELFINSIYWLQLKDIKFQKVKWGLNKPQLNNSLVCIALFSSWFMITFT